MSRRDTIIIAVLVNAGLLMVLFATAMRTDKSSIEISEAPPATQEIIASAPVPTKEDLLASYASAPTLCDPGHEIVLEEALSLTLPPPLPIEEISQVREVVSEPPKPQSHPSTVNVTVKKGDALEKIARANNTSVASIMEANRLSSTQLKIGQVLKVPIGTRSKTPATQENSVGEFYLVKEGDSPWLIASKNNIRLDELLRINGLDDQKARRLRPGDRLRIR